MANAKLPQEGVDVPAVDLAKLIDPKYAAVDVAQLAVRVMRKDLNNELKTDGHVLVPVFADEHGEVVDDAWRW